jgi:DNA-binding transcriptional ArsR family regulator
MVTEREQVHDLVFQALADPVRRGLLNRLSRGDHTAGALAEPFSISRPAISRHLRVLRDAGLVSVRTEGRERWFALDADGFTDAELWLDELRYAWRSSAFELTSFVEGWE